MIERRHADGGRHSRALYSDCSTYRYLLERRWAEGAPMLYLLLNPSTATELRNDPTIERCERRARALGHAGFAVANIFAFRATRPQDLMRAADPVGAGNDDVLVDAALAAAAVVCGWGVHGAYLGRGAKVTAALRDMGVPLCHLGLTKAGHPRHPLYAPYAIQPMPWVA